jgi:hypothetical protein
MSFEVPSAFLNSVQFMSDKKKPWRKGLLIGLGICLGLFILAILCASPIVKHLLLKNDEKWTGRHYTIGWLYANPFTGYCHLRDVTIYEYKSDSVFLTSESVSLRFNLRKLLAKEYQIDYLTLTRPLGTAIQYTKHRFNFTDLVQKFSRDPKKPRKKGGRTKFSLIDIQIEDGRFYWKEHITPVFYFIKDVNIKSTGMRWNADTIANTFSFNSGIGSGKFEGHITLNTKNSLYRSHIIIRRLDLKIVEQYLKELSKNAKFRALINLDITADGDLKDGRNINAVGGVGIYDFHIGETEKKDFASFKKFVMKIDHLNPRKKIYDIDSISLVEPFALYARYDYLDNIQHMFGVKGSRVRDAEHSGKFNLVIAIADYVRLLAKNFFHSNYRINRVGMYRSDLQYEDYSLPEKFVIGVKPLTIIADSLGSDKAWARMRLNSGIKPYGSITLSLSINPKDSSDFDLNYHIQKINAAVLNPFLLAYTSFPVDRGSIYLKGNWRVRNGEISSTNHLLVIDPRLTNRVRTNKNKWLPLKLAMFFARDWGNTIDYEIPITGNLKHARFHLRDVFMDALGNALVKPATTHYRYEIREIENAIEKTIGFNWEPGSAKMIDGQESYVERVAKFLKKNPNASIAVFPFHYEAKEKEYIAFFEAKKKYFLILNKRPASAFTEDDSIDVAHMSPKDSLFNRFMRQHLKDSAMYTTQQLCSAFVGQHLIHKKYAVLNNARKEHFLAYFNGEGVAERLAFRKSAAIVPFNGFSFYQLTYNGEIPESMKAAFTEICQYDNAAPRKKLKKERASSRRFFNSKKNK